MINTDEESCRSVLTHLESQVHKSRTSLFQEKNKSHSGGTKSVFELDPPILDGKLYGIGNGKDLHNILSSEYHENGWRKIPTHAQAMMLMLNGEIVSLWGPKGTGKTEYWINLSKDLGWRLPYIITAPMFKTDLTGFIDAMGKYQGTQFTEGFQCDAEHPCLVLIEEVDRATPEALIALNSALANGIMDTPVGNIHKGEGCHVVFTANTNGNGASQEYITANQLDSSTVDRAKWLYCGYDSDVLRSICGENIELYSFAKDVIQSIKKIGHIRGISMTYRTVRDIKVSESIFKSSNINAPTVKAIDCSMTKGADAAEIRSVFDSLLHKENKYAVALNNVPTVMQSAGEY